MRNSKRIKGQHYRIGFSAMLTEKGQSGIGQYTLQLLNHLADLDSVNTYFIFGIKGDSTLESVNAKNFTLKLSHPIFSYPVFNVLWHLVLLPWLAFKYRLHLLHFPTHRRLCLWSPVPTVATVHDFAAIHQPKKYGRLRHWYMKAFLLPLLRRVQFILAVSRSTLDDLALLVPSLGSKTTVVYNGLDHTIFRKLPPREKENEIFLSKYKIDIPFILFVSRIEHPGKNHVGLIQGYSLMKRQHNVPHGLVLAGGPWNGADFVYQMAKDDAFASEIHFVGFVPQEDLPLFYNLATVVVIPSLWEGFGFPVLEAMACGTPVACSNVGSLPEISGGIPNLFNPQNPQNIADAIFSLLNPPFSGRQEVSVRGMEWAKTFSWDRAARETLSVYFKVIEDGT